MNTTLLCLMGLLALTNALPSGPKETPPPSLEQRDNAVLAYHAEKPRAAASSVTAAAGGPNQLTITVVNKMDEAVSTSYVGNAGVPGPVSGGTGTGTMKPGATATLVAPRDWAGNVAVNLEKYEMNGDGSLLEGSLMSWGNVGYRVDMDVSYVNGFSVPITCSCNADKAVLSGCSLDLWGMGTCSGDSGTDNGQGACANPLRPDNSAKLTATGFFAPCEGAAFTWPRDDANSEGKCQGAEVTCCIGTTGDGCPANPKQKGGA